MKNGFWILSISLMALAAQGAEEPRKKAKLTATETSVYACTDIPFSWQNVPLAEPPSKSYIMLSRLGTPAASTESTYLNLTDENGTGKFPTAGLSLNFKYVLRAMNAKGKLLSESDPISILENYDCPQPNVYGYYNHDRTSVGVSFFGFPIAQPGEYHWIAVAEVGAPNSAHLDVISLKTLRESDGYVEIPLIKAKGKANLEVRAYMSWRPGILNYHVAGKNPIE